MTGLDIIDALRRDAAFLCGIACGVIVLFFIGLAFPGLTREDGLVETLTALLFGLSAVLAIWTAVQTDGARGFLERLAFLGLAAFALLLMLSEISFGSRLFGFEMPAMAGGGEFDGGHDIVIWTLRKVEGLGHGGKVALAAACIAAGAAVIAFAYVHRRWLAGFVGWFLGHPARLRLSATVALLGAAVTLDLITSYKASILEEMIELTASASLLATVAAARRYEAGLLSRLDLRPTDARVGAPIEAEG